MKIYKHEFDERTKEVKTIEIDVEEKPKTYAVTNSKWFYPSKILKTDIGVLQGRYTTYMFTLSPDKSDFVKAMIEFTEKGIKNLKKSLSNCVECKTALLKILDNLAEN